MKSSILKSTIPFDPNKLKSDQTITGASPPAVFVGYQGYPEVNIGPLIPLGEYAEKKDTTFLDAPETWYGTSIQEIIAYRSGMVRSNFKMGVKYNQNVHTLTENLNLDRQHLLDTTQELTMAARSVDTEAHLSKIRIGMDFDNHSQPQGPSGVADKINVTENVPVARQVDKAVSDRDLNATDAVYEVLYKSKEIPITNIQRLFSVGLLGEEKRRRLVPTRWSITAVDDIIGKNIAPRLFNFPEIDRYMTFYDEYLDNKFVILLVPGRWAFEMSECWNASSIWNQPVPGIYKPEHLQPVIVTDFELEQGRTTYASNVTGAYYAARKEIEEWLFNHQRQARAFVFREVSGGYIVPLGVWVIRETVRHAMELGSQGTNLQYHDSLESALQRITQHLQVPIKYWVKSSGLIPYIRSQRTLDFWIKKSKGL
jgi:hypothetical protein